ncbi:MAG: NtrZ family periplasmic regulatory protein [Caulobacteraceae bacterium]
MAALALSGVAASAARAESVNSDPSKILAERSQWAPLVQHKTMEWDAAKSRFGLRLDVEQQPGAAGSETKNVQAGAFFKITPSLRVGAGVTLGDQQTSTANPLAQQPTPPRVHFETAWKF